MQRSLLACLLLEANRPVPVDRLAAWLWPGDPPRDVRTTLRGYVMRLRRSLGQDRIETRDPGYLLRARDDELDLLRFRRAANRAHAESDERANRLWREALAEWRGEPLSNVPCDALHREFVPELVEQRLLALDSRIDGDLRLGRHADVVADLTEVLRAHPLRERFWAHLMLAQYRSSRQADALDSYQRIRALLAEELGVEPSPELRELHRSILAGDVAPVPTAHVAPVPAHLPPDVYAFTGRADGLAELDGVAASADGRVAIAVLTGSAGWARPRSPCTGRTATATGSRTGSSSSTCAATDRRTRSTPPTRSRRCCARWARPSHPAPRSAPRCSARSWPSARRSSCWTTPAVRTRSARSSPARRPAPCW
ncbi:BTAD domain-containing putative transcriptional regulator [Actinokineospora soli]|uniref:BTAD domain-containing putative transcriptional regulator n=1 Tax=Actinokineospora soli TaxID=1048753 RepID=A0ABW2TZM6_9PSEU